MHRCLCATFSAHEGSKIGRYLASQSATKVSCNHITWWQAQTKLNTIAKRLIAHSRPAEEVFVVFPEFNGAKLFGAFCLREHKVPPSYKVTDVHNQ